MVCSLPGSSVHGISQARTLAWVVVSTSGDLPDPGIKLMSSALVGGFFPAEPKGNPFEYIHIGKYKLLYFRSLKTLLDH